MRKPRPHANRPAAGSLALLASPAAAQWLFLVLAAALGADTLLEGTDSALSPWSLAALSALGVNLAACTWQRRRRLSAAALLIHAGVLTDALGAAAGAMGGYVATVNIYEGGWADRAYRWDKRRDAPLGFSIGVRAIRRRHYPAAVKVGVVRDGRRLPLVTTRVGGTFRVPPHTVTVTGLEQDTGTLVLSVDSGGVKTTLRSGKEPPGSPLRFTLVAFRPPALKEVWVEMEARRNGETVARGACGVNRPLSALGLRFYHTATGRDAAGRPFAGIQIVRDPGVPVVYAGFGLTGAGCLLLVTGWGRRRYPLRKKR